MLVFDVLNFKSHSLQITQIIDSIIKSQQQKITVSNDVTS